MEDALVRFATGRGNTRPQVLILVLMEDALVRDKVMGQVKNFGGLNPCFNGRCTRTG